MARFVEEVLPLVPELLSRAWQVGHQVELAGG